MEVLIVNGARQYTVNTLTKKILRVSGRGRPPHRDKQNEIIQEAVKLASQGINSNVGMPRPEFVPTAKPSTNGITVRPSPVVTLTDDQIMERMVERDEMFRNIVEGVTYGDFPAAVISGGPGMGKSHTAEEILREAKNTRGTSYKIIQGGNVTPIKLFDQLYKYRNRGNVIVMDDSDTILGDEQGMMMLKSALDSKVERTLSWLSNAAKEAPDEYVFCGSLIFLTNQNFQHAVDNGNPNHKRVQHLQAIMSRVNYLDLMMPDNRSRWLWTFTQIRRHRILEKKGLTAKEQTEVLDFIREHVDDLREVSIRSAVNMIPFVLMNRRDASKDWKRAVRIMSFR